MLPLPVQTLDPNIQRLGARQRETFPALGVGGVTLTLGDAPIEGHEQVIKNGAVLMPGADYTLNGRTVLLAAPIAGGDRFQVIYYYRQGA